LASPILGDAKRREPYGCSIHLAFWRMEPELLRTRCSGSWPQADAGGVLWSHQFCANDWQLPKKKLTRALHNSGAGRCFRRNLDRNAPTRWSAKDSSDRCSGFRITRAPQRKTSEQPGSPRRIIFIRKGRELFGSIGSPLTGFQVDLIGEVRIEGGRPARPRGL